MSKRPISFDIYVNWDLKKDNRSELIQGGQVEILSAALLTPIFNLVPSAFNIQVLPN